MSQAKVDRYKEEKRNRDKIIKKQKREWMATKAGLSLVGLLLVVWAGVSIYNGVTAPEPTTDRPVYTVDTSALDTYINEIGLE